MDWGDYLRDEAAKYRHVGIKCDATGENKCEIFKRQNGKANNDAAAGKHIRFSHREPHPADFAVRAPQYVRSPPLASNIFASANQSQ
jgi:hypothetical protein